MTKQIKTDVAAGLQPCGPSGGLKPAGYDSAVLNRARTKKWLAIVSAFVTFAFCLLPSALTLTLAQQARDVGRPQSGTAVLSGTVMTDEPTSRPLRRAMVMIFSPGDNGRQRITTTDDAGRFEFAGLPAGNVTVFASKPSYVTTYYGATRPGATTGVPIALVEGQRAAITLRMLRGAVITGAIVDETGKLASSVPVRLLRVSVSASGDRSTSAVNLLLAPGGNTTDDRGVYRIYGLPPGDYMVSAQPRMATPLAQMNGGSGELRQTTVEELRWAERQIQGATASGPEGAAPPPGAAVTYANVFYPGTADAGAATTITVTAGQERSGVDFPLQFVSTAHVDGMVSDSNGRPAAGVQVTMLQKTAANDDVGRLTSLAAVGLVGSGLTSRTQAGGKFSIQGVEPGHYILLARLGGAPAGRATGPSTPTFWALADVDVAGHDVQDLALTLAPGMTVSGRFVFESKTRQPPADSVRMSIAATQSTGATVAATIPVTGDATFSVPDIVPSTYRVYATLAGWTLKSAMAGTRDVADVPFEIKPGENIPDIVVTFTDAASGVSGVLYDAAGRPTSDLSIVLFSADKSLWFQGSRRLRAPARPASDGTFQFTGLPAGDYYLAALTDFAPNDWFNPVFLEQVLPAAIRITLGAGEQKTQDVRIGR